MPKKSLFLKTKKISPLTVEDLRACSEDICREKFKHKHRNYRDIKDEGVAHSICNLDIHYLDKFP